MKTEKLINKLLSPDSEWEQRLRQSLGQMPFATDEAHLQATIMLAKTEVSFRQERKRLAFPRFLAKQIRFMWRTLWAAQVIFLLLLRFLFSCFYASPLSLRHLIKLLAILSILVFMTALPLLHRSARYRMQEIESASHFSGIRLLLARLIVIGIGDACLLTGIFLTVILKTVLPADSAAFSLCFPFLLAGCGCLYLLGHYPPERFFVGSLLLCFLLVVLIGILPDQYLILCKPFSGTAQIILCALPLAFCVQQLCRLRKLPSFEEIQLN